MKKLTTASIILLISITAFTQEIISTSGNYNKQANTSISWTIGESVIETFSQSANVLTQGFQQSKLTVTSVEKIN